MAKTKNKTKEEKLPAETITSEAEVKQPEPEVTTTPDAPADENTNNTQPEVQPTEPTSPSEPVQPEGDGAQAPSDQQDSDERHNRESKAKSKFIVYTKLNGIEREVKTDDIAQAILDSKLEFPKTPLTVRVTNKKGKTLDRYIQLNQAKRMFIDKIAMEAFIKNLIF